MIKAVFIDVDNTLLDFEAYVQNALRDGFARFGIGAYEDSVYEVFTEENNKLWHAIEDGLLTFERLQEIRFNNVFSRLGISYDGPAFESYFRAELNHSGVPMPGAMEMVRALSGKVELYAASNGPQSQQESRLDAAGMLPMFNGVFTSGGLGASKPDRAFFDAAFAVMNTGRTEPLHPSECLMLGDSLTSDIAGGAAYGMKTCLYAPFGLPDDPQPKPDRTVSDLTEIPELIYEL